MWSDYEVIFFVVYFTIVSLFPKLFSDISFRRTDTIFGLVIFNAQTVSSYNFLVSLTWVINFRVGEKRIH